MAGSWLYQVVTHHKKGTPEVIKVLGNVTRLGAIQDYLDVCRAQLAEAEWTFAQAQKLEHEEKQRAAQDK